MYVRRCKWRIALGKLFRLIVLFGIVFFGSSFHKVNSQDMSGDRTAILFLIDESGGVNGQCPDAAPVTDENGKRYEFIRFFFSLWEAYHSSIWKNGNDLKTPPLSLGIARFADSYEDVQKFIDADNLDGNIEAQKEFTSLGILSNHPRSWSCHTDYLKAFEGGMNAFPEDASKRILVLITDGSFKGTGAVRDNDRASVKQRLIEMHDEGVEIYVWLLGKQMCVHEGQNECENLSPDDINRRVSDLSIWDALQDDEIITILDTDHPIESFVRDEKIATLLPGASYQAELITLSAKKPTELFPLLGSVDRVRMIIVASGSGISGIRVKDGNNFEPSTSMGGGRWGYLEKELPLDGSGKCQRRSHWSMSVVGEDVDVYYWLITENQPPRIADVSVSPDFIMLPNDSHVTVSVTLSGKPYVTTQHLSCYQVVVEVGNERKTLPLADGMDFSLPVFNIPVAQDTPWGMLPVTAKIQYVNAPDVPLSHGETHVEVQFEPEIGEVRAIRNDDNVEITIPILYAAKIPNFEAHFLLSPNKFDGDDMPLLPAGCANYSSPQDAERFVETKGIGRNIVGDSWVFTVSVPFTGTLNERCNYKFVRVRWLARDDVSGQIWGAVPDLSLSLPPSPPSSPLPKLKWIYLLAALPFIVLFMVLAGKRR